MFDDRGVTLDSIALLPGVPQRVFAGDGSLSSGRIMLEQLLRDEQRSIGKLQAAMRPRLVEMVDDWWYASHRAKHRTVGQGQRDFWRAMAKINGIKQTPPFTIAWDKE